MPLTEYRLVADLIHGAAILLLFYQIIKNRSCHSVSGITVMLYAITFTCRYLDLYPFYSYQFEGVSAYNTIFKIYYLVSHYLILILIYGVFRHTRDKLINTLPIFAYLILAHILAWITCFLENIGQFDKEFFWRFSIFLEMLAIIPQMNLTYKQGTVNTTILFYMSMLGTYRALYIANWIYRYYNENILEPIAFFGGCMQTMIYLYFFFHVYPRLKNMKSSQEVEIKKEKLSNVDTKEVINEKTGKDVPLIHDIV
ncbi:hypothetical protein I4U23_023519 [Adineta vaga]|nr:hypothetical protein I4U23_023519 [Adineta vaga]